MYLEYSPNNGGGSFWHTDKQWQELIDLGWVDLGWSGSHYGEGLHYELRWLNKICTYLFFLVSDTNLVNYSEMRKLINGFY